MKKGKLRSNKGISIADVIIAMLILSMFVGIIGSLYYKILYNSNLIRMNALAVHYSVKIAEEIDKMSYEEVEDTLNSSIKSKYSIPDDFTVQIKVKKYNETDPTKRDILKIVTIETDYQCLNEAKSYELMKLKVKES